MDHQGVVFTHTGEYLEITRPHRLVFSWIIPLPDGERSTLVTVNLEAAEGRGTQMEILHERLPDPDMVGRHEVGWTAITQRLTQHLRSRAR